VEKITVEWITFHNEEHHDLYFLPNIIWVFESGKTCGTYKREEKMRTEFWRGNLKEIDHLREKRPKLHERLILTGILRNENWRAVMDCSGLGYGRMAGRLEQRIEH
jgi:hypothetical protein